MDFLTRIRSKSPHVRVQYAVGTAGLVTGIIMVIWLSTIPARFADLGGHATSTETDAAKNVKEAADVPSPAEPEAQELGALQLNRDAASSTATTSSAIEGTTSASVASSSAPRVIQIGTTSQNER
jgi:hypothetical protein